jgi:hypothetical protein
MSTSRLNTAFLLSMTSVWAHPTFVYTNNNGNVNTVSAFSVGVNGALTPVPGSPFATGGTGGPSAAGSAQIVTTLAKHFVYVTNPGSLPPPPQSSTISAFLDRSEYRQTNTCARLPLSEWCQPDRGPGYNSG